LLNVRVLPVLLALAAAAPAPWRYEVTWAQGTLSVQAELPPGSGRGLRIGAPGFVRDVRVDGAPGRLDEADCRRGCRLQYRFALTESAGEVRDAERSGRVVATRPGHWLAVPHEAPPQGRFALTVHTPADIAFACGLERTGDAWVGPAEHLDAGPYVAFGPMTLTDLPVAGARRVTLALEPGRLQVSPKVVEAWVTREADRVARYFGGLPVPDLLVLVLPVPRDDIPFGTAHGLGGAAVRLYVGREAPEAAFTADWKLRHELVHLGLPNLPSRHRWMEEGLATYLEATLGAPDDAALWSELVDGLPQGLPQGQGLDGTRRWGETYWGGALYWLLCDLELRVATGGAKGLQDALRALRAAGGNMSVRWPLARTLAAADAGTGRQVLTELHQAFGVRGAPVELEALLARLGVSPRRGGVELTDEAPWARYRQQLRPVSDAGAAATRSPARSR
jgi:hypothetical protein